MASASLLRLIFSSWWQRRLSHEEILCMIFISSYLTPTADEKAPLQPHPKLSAWIGGSYYLQERHPAIHSQRGTNGRINEHCFGMLKVSCLSRTKGCNGSSEGLAAPWISVHQTGRILKGQLSLPWNRKHWRIEKSQHLPGILQLLCSVLADELLKGTGTAWPSHLICQGKLAKASTFDSLSLAVNILLQGTFSTCTTHRFSELSALVMLWHFCACRANASRILSPTNKMTRRTSSAAFWQVTRRVFWLLLKASQKLEDVEGATQQQSRWFDPDGSERTRRTSLLEENHSRHLLVDIALNELSVSKQNTLKPCSSLASSAPCVWNRWRSWCHLQKNVNIQFTLDIEIHCIYVDPVYLNMCFYLCFYTQLPRNQIPRDKCVGLSSQEASTWGTELDKTQKNT